MYNGIGLQTARGSGTSGHIQKNISYNVKKVETKQQFLKRMEQARTNNLPKPRKANPEIVEHERKRQILIQKMKLKSKLEEEGVPEQQINHRLEKAEKIMKQKLQKGQIQTKNKDTHILTEAKQRQYTKLTEAFGLKEGEKLGSAFNFEQQRQQRFKKLQQRRQRFTFTCPHDGCEKSYDSQHRLDRHLKFKHVEQQKKLQDEKKKLE